MVSIICLGRNIHRTCTLKSVCAIYMYMYLVEEVEPVDVVGLQDQLDEVTGTVQVDRFQLSRLERQKINTQYNIEN